MKKKIILFLLLLLCSCSIRRQVEQTQHSSTYDSVVVKVAERIDSVYIDRYHTITQSGDTIYRTDSVICYKWQWRTNTDTMVVAKTDTLYIERTTTQDVRNANKLTSVCTALFFGMLALIGIGVWKHFIKR